jgi:polysaccharide export outer membrane protein
MVPALLSTLFLLAQAASPRPPAAPAAPSPRPTPASTEYRIGPGDVLEVTVFGNEDLSRTTTVQPSGAVTLALLGEVQVAGLTVPEVKARVTSMLGRDFLVNPQVEVAIREYQSQFVTIIGEVNTPGRKPLRGRTRLVDALIEAGGFTPRASGELTISRPGGFEGGQSTMRLRLGGETMTPQEQIALELPLRTGDIVTASAKQYVTVEGEVSRPNRYTLEADLTVSAAISMAGGLTKYGSSDVRVRRVNPATGAVEILKVDLKDVRKGKELDPLLQPNDVVSVARRLF